jgi:hypothetical protein
MSGRDDAEDRRRYNQPYTPKHTIPTIQKYREEKDKRREQAGTIDEDRGEDDELMSRKETARQYWHRGDNDSERATQQEDEEEKRTSRTDEEDATAGTETPQDTSQVDPGSIDPKTRRKSKKKKHKSERMEREVTDPVTHLPVRIFDFTDEALEEVKENEPPSGSTDGQQAPGTGGHEQTIPTAGIHRGAKRSGGH